MQQNIESLFNHLWNQYSQLNPEVKKIAKLLSAGEAAFQNDHVAFRTFDTPELGVDSFAQVFIDLGYKECGDYHFEQKKLYAKHYEHPKTSLPKVFISQLLLSKCSSTLNNIVKPIINSTELGKIDPSQLCYSGRVWNPISYADYETLYAESEYAAWLSAFGFCANHFTVYLNTLNKFTELAELNEFLKVNGYILNSSGGEIKGSPEELLEQSSTMAHKIEVAFSDGVYPVPSVYYEFAKRYKDKSGNIYQGFVASSADKIFESTNN